MTQDQVWMLIVLVAVGGAFLLAFFLLRRWSDGRKALLARRLAAAEASINLGGPGSGDSSIGLGMGSTLRTTGDSGHGLGDSSIKLGDSATKLSGGSGIKLGGDSSTKLSGSGVRSGYGSATKLTQGGARGSTILQPGLQTALAGDSAIMPEKGLTARFDRGFNRMVERAGLGWGPEQALGIICLCGVLAAAGLYLWKEELWFSLVGMLLGMAIPLGILMVLQARWQRQLQEQMPDGFFFLARSLRAGLSLEQALAVSGNQGARPLADEFRRCADRVRLGLPVPTALELTSRRIHLLDFNVFVSLVALHQTTGGNLAMQLDRLATSVRDRNQYQGYFRSATALGRMTAIAIGAAVPLIFLGYSLFQPEFALRFFQSGQGLAMLATAFVLEIIGAIWLYFLLKVSY
jgi:tight adherence protein B